MLQVCRTSLLGGQYLNPIIVGVVDEIESHGGIFETYPAVFLVILADCIIVSGHAEAEMAFVLAQFVGLGMFFQAGQFQKKTRAAVGEIDQRERAVRRLFPMMFLQSQCLFVEAMLRSRLVTFILKWSNLLFISTVVTF